MPIRRFLYIFIAFLSVLNIDAQNSSDSTTDVPILGDVNSDGTVDISDVLLTVDYILGTPSEIFVRENADMNNDQVIDISDVLLMVDKILGREQDIPDDGTPEVDDDGANPYLPVLAPRR